MTGTTSEQLTITLANLDATDQLAEHLASLAAPNVVLLLDGPVGAGKSTLARHIIQTVQAQVGPVEDVPSPTFTIVQTYEAGDLEIWHADLYRLTDTQELIELGLEAAFDEAFCIIEWPDRLGSLTPDALHIELSFLPEVSSRQAVLSATGSNKAHLQTISRAYPS